MQSDQVYVGSRRGKGFAIGVISILLGLAALLFPWVATLGLEILFGILLLITGVLELVRVFSDRAVGGGALGAVFGLVALLAGILLLMYPLEGAITLTLVLAVFFLLGGIFKASSAMALRPIPGWGWMMTSAVVSILLGVIVLAALPESAMWLLGVLFGIDLLFFGAAQIAFASSVGRTGASARP